MTKCTDVGSDTEIKMCIDFVSRCVSYNILSYFKPVIITEYSTSMEGDIKHSLLIEW